jgi:CDP-diacylglycerol--serine O-phosphatidyltransferase
MPIPAAAGVLAAVIHFESGSPIHNLWMSLIWLALVAFTGFLMVSSWRFWSGKEIDMNARKPGRLLVLLVVVIGVVVEWHSTALLVIALGYLVSGVMARLAYSWKRRIRKA